MLLYKRIHQSVNVKSKILLFPLQRAEQFTFSTLRKRTACSCSSQPQATIWLPKGLSGDSEKEKKMLGRFLPPAAVCRSTPGFCQCSLSHSQCSISKEILVGLGWGNRGQEQSDFDCVGMFGFYLVSCFIFSLFNPIFIIVPAIVLPLYTFDCSVQSEFEWWNGASTLEKNEFFRRLPSPLGEKYY